MISNKIGNYIPVEWDGVNRSGIRLLGDEVMILPDTVPETTKGGIIIAKTTQETHGLAAQTGTIITVGPDAWRWDRSRTREFTNPEKPKPGDRVIFDRYGGKRQHGLDGKEYLIMSDFVIAGMFVDTEEETTNAA
jgi:co-chaperonin GroES (HSP10)